MEPSPPQAPSNPEAHPAQRFLEFVCREIDRLIAKRRGFGVAFTIYKKSIDRGFYVSVSVVDADFERINYQALLKMKKEHAMDAIQHIYEQNHDVSQEEKDDIFKRGEMTARLQQGAAPVIG